MQEEKNAEREVKHVLIINSINQLKVAVSGLEVLESKVFGEPITRSETEQDDAKPAPLSLVSFLEETSLSIIACIDRIDKIKSNLKKGLF